MQIFDHQRKNLNSCLVHLACASDALNRNELAVQNLLQTRLMWYKFWLHCIQLSDHQMCDITPISKLRLLIIISLRNSLLVFICMSCICTFNLDSLQCRFEGLKWWVCHNHWIYVGIKSSYWISCWNSKRTTCAYASTPLSFSCICTLIFAGIGSSGRLQSSKMEGFGNITAKPQSM